MGIKFTTKGFIELWRGTVKVSQHTLEVEAIERATVDYEATGNALYTLRYPNKEVDLSRLTRVIRDVDVTRPTTPAGFSLNPVSASQINLFWTVATDPQGAATEANTGVAGYRVYRNGSLRTTTTSLSFSDTGLTEYTLYSYYVTAFDGATPANESVATTTATLRTLDVTAPTTPVITASATGQTSLSVALTTPSTDAHSGVATYRLEYKRTVDSTWTLDSATLTAASFPRSISGLTAATAYDTRCRATDVSGNVGAFSATSSATTTASSGSPTLNADWNSIRASAVMSTRFDTSGEVTDYRLLDGKSGNITHDTSRRWYGAGSLKINIPTGDSENSGNWFRHLDDSFGLFTGSGGQPGGASNSTNQGYTPPMVFEVAFGVYIPAALRNTVFPSGAGWKLGILSHDGQSNNSFEIVWQNTEQRGYVQGYYQNPGNVAPPSSGIEVWDTSLSSGCSAASPDFLHEPNIDHGANALSNLSATRPDTGAAWSACQQAWGRYGGLYSYGVSGYPDAASGSRIWKFWEQLDPFGAYIGPFLLPADDWMALKFRVDLNSYSAATNRVRAYAARRHHTSWQLLADLQNVILNQEIDGFGGGFQKRYNSVWLTPFHTSRTSGGGTSTQINYGFVVSRRDGGAIPLPQIWPELGTTTLATAAAALANEQWGSITVSGLTQSLISPFNSDSIMSFMPRAQWDYVHHKAFLYGGTHDAGTITNSYEALIRYDDNDNTWRLEEAHTPEDSPGGGSSQPHHGYCHRAVRPTDGQQFQMFVGGNTVKMRPYAGTLVSNPTWTTLPSVGGEMFIDFNTQNTLAWFPEMHGGEGALVFASDSRFCKTWRESTNTWTSRATSNNSPSTEPWSVYCERDSRVYFGGSTRMWSIDASGVVTAETNPPFAISSGSSNGNSNPSSWPGRIIAPSNGGKLSAHTGAGALYEYTRGAGGAGTWAALGTSLPFSYSDAQVVNFPTEYGVTAFVYITSGNSVPSSTMWLWKH